jgi:hypothetical protein
VAQGTLIPASADIQGGTYHAYHRNDSRRRSYHLAPHLGRAEADPAGQGLAEQRGSGLSDPHANAGPDPADAHTVSDAGSAHAVPDAGATDTVSDPGSAHAVPDDRTGHPDRDDNRSSPAHSGASNADHRTRGPGARFRHQRLLVPDCRGLRGDAQDQDRAHRPQHLVPPGVQREAIQRRQ